MILTEKELNKKIKLKKRINNISLLITLALCACDFFYFKFVFSTFAFFDIWYWQILIAIAAPVALYWIVKIALNVIVKKNDERKRKKKEADLQAQKAKIEAEEGLQEQFIKGSIQDIHKKVDMNFVNTIDYLKPKYSDNNFTIYVYYKNLNYPDKYNFNAFSVKEVELITEKINVRIKQIKV